MPSKPNEHVPNCPIGPFLEILTRPWTMHILWALGMQGPLRFGELKRHVPGISSRVLTERLRNLEKKKFIYRHYEATIPPAVTYGVTKRLERINKVFGELTTIAVQWQKEDGPEEAPKLSPRAKLRQASLEKAALFAES